MRKLKLLSLILIIGFTVSNCGKQEEDEDAKLVGVNITPGTGVVINSNYKYIIDYPTPTTDNPDPAPITEEVEGPWVTIRFNVTNSNPNYNLYIMGIRILIFAADGTGNIVSSEHNIEPADMIENRNIDKNDDRDFIFGIAPSPTPSTQGWYISGLPKVRKEIEAGDTNFDTRKIKYSAIVEFVGFFAPLGTVDLRIDSLNQPAVKGFSKIVRWKAEL